MVGTMLISTPLPRKFRALLRFGVARRILHTIFASDSTPKKWVFVTGCYNSGTTLLARILEADPRINTLPGEGVRYTAELTRPEDIGWTRMWCKCVNYVTMSASTQPQKAKLLRRDWSLFYTKSGTINLEKSIVSVPRMPWINANFDNAWFVGIIRCPFAVSKGIQRRAKPVNAAGAPELTEYTMEMAAEQWTVANETLAKHASNLANSAIVTYEDLIESPVETVQAIYRAIGETPPALEFKNGTLSVAGVALKINTDENKKRQDSLLSEDRAAVTAIVKASPVQSMLTAHGISNYISVDGTDNSGRATLKDSV